MPILGSANRGFIMTVRKIRVKERENGMRYCTYCKPARVDAIWRDCRLNFACEDHKPKLSKGDSGHYTEADHQTWMRL